MEKQSSAPWVHMPLCMSASSLLAVFKVADVVRIEWPWVFAPLILMYAIEAVLYLKRRWL